MTRLEEIYERVYGELPEGKRADQELTEQIKGRLRRMGIPEEDEQEMSDLMFIGSSFGQKHGFYMGFSFAMALVFESLVG